MRSLLIMSALLIGFSGAAYAGEGNGDPFPAPDASVASLIPPHPYVAKDQDPYQFRVAGTVTNVQGVRLSVNHSQDPFQYRVPGVRSGGSSSALASRDQRPTATNAKTEAAAPHS